MNGKVTYNQQISYCGKSHCHKCRNGIGHGPYWYAYQTVNGRTTRTYVGKHLPADVQASREKTQFAQLSPLSQTSEGKQTLLRIYTLGQFRIERRTETEWQTVNDSAWQQQRVRSLLSCVMSSNARKLGRELLLETLWPDLDPETAGHRLDRSVYNLRQLFEPTRSKPATSPLLLTEREALVLASHPLIWIDADAFEHLLAQAQEAIDTNNSAEAERLLEVAESVYGGDYVPEEQEIEWIVTRREKLRRNWIGLLLNLADVRVAHNALNEALAALDRLLSIDSLNEAAVQRLMRILAQLGRRGEALRAYKRLASTLQQEQHIAPLLATRSIYDAILKDSAYAKATTSRATASEGVQAESPGQLQQARLTSEIVLQIGRMHQFPLVGREQELSTLRDLITTSETMAKFKLPGQKKTVTSPFDVQHHPQSLLLMGEVGIGKTRLAEEVGREARQRGWAVAWSRLYVQEGSIPYRVWIEVLRKAIEQSHLSSTQLPSFYSPLSTLLPELQSLLPESIFPSSSEQEQLRLWEAVRALLTTISEETPLLIVLDDLQWADRSSCELLAYLARHIHGYPIVMLGTCRDNELSDTSPLRSLLTDLQREHTMETLSLQPLSDEQITTLITQILTNTRNNALPSQPTQPVFSYIQNHAAGNPFFAEELARTMLAGASESASSVGDKPTPLTLPETITAVLDLRLARLSPACQHVLGKAAVLGGSFEFSTLCHMDANTPDSNEDVVLELIEEALDAGMLTEEGIGTRITYQFWHPLLVSHLYESLSAARRANLHRRAAEILLKLYTQREEEGAATISYHLLEGGADSDQIAFYSELAGNRAYALSAYPEAEKHYRLTLEHLDNSIDEQLHRASLLELLGECTSIQGKYEEARHFYEQAFDVRRQQSNPTTTSQQEVQIQALLLYEIARAWYDVGDNAKSRLYCERSEQVLREAKIISGLGLSKLRYHLSHISWREGSYKEARHLADEALELFNKALELHEQVTEYSIRPTRIRRTLTGDFIDLGRIQMLLGLIANGAGRSNNALEHFTDALTLFEQHDYQREIAILCCNLGDLYLRKADYPLAQSVLRRSLSIAERIGDIPVKSFAIGNLGILNLRIGNLIDAEKEFSRGITFTERVDDSASLSLWDTYLAIVLQEQGKLSEAKTTLSLAMTISRSTHIAPIIGLALVALGNLRVTQAVTACLDEENIPSREERQHLLRRAKKTLQHALESEGMEAETRIEGQLAQVQVQLQLHELETAYEEGQQILQEAQQSQLVWLVARIQCILGCILVAKEEPKQATLYFEQALRIFRKHGIRLEHGRTLQHYGLLLIQQESGNEKSYQRGLNFLREAHQLFTECHAQLEVQRIEHILVRYE